MITAAILATLVYWFGTAETYFVGWQCLQRPIVMAPLMGLLLGDVHTGIIMGASLEAIFMGISAIGGSVPSDCCSASVIAVAYTILTGSNAETGLAIALPIGTLMSSVNSMLMPFWSALAGYWEKVAATGNMKAFQIQTTLVTLAMMLPGGIIIFLGVGFGVKGLSSALAACPAWVTTGLNASSSMMVAVGFAILCSMIWSGRNACFYFVGFVLAKCLKLDSLQTAIIGAAIAVVLFFINKDIIDLKNKMLKSSTKTGTDGEEDFF